MEACEAPRRLLVLTREPDQSEDQSIEVTLTADGGQTTVVWEGRGMPVAYLAGHGAGIQVHVEDLGAYLAGRQRCDAGARMGELSPPTSPWPPRSARLGKPTAGPARAAGHPPCPSTSTPIISGSPVNWLPASAGTALATHRPLPWPMNPVAEPMPAVVDSDPDIVEFPISPQARPQHSLGQHQRSQAAIGIPAKQLSSFPSAGHTWDRPGAAVECLGKYPSSRHGAG